MSFPFHLVAMKVEVSSFPTLSSDGTESTEPTIAHSANPVPAEGVGRGRNATQQDRRAGGDRLRHQTPDCLGAIAGDGITALGLPYVVGICPATTVWAPGVEPLPPKAWSGRGAKPKRLRRGPGQEPIAVKELAMRLAYAQYANVTWRDGTQAALTSRFACLRVRLAHRGHLAMTVRAEEWLLIEWPAGDEQPASYWLATAPDDATLEQLVFVAKMRWRIERDYRELKQEFGLSHYEGRNWRGFHHHATLYIAAYAFLTAHRLTHDDPKKNGAEPETLALPPDYVPRGRPASVASRAELHQDSPPRHRARDREQTSSMPLLRRVRQA